MVVDPYCRDGVGQLHSDPACLALFTKGPIKLPFMEIR